MRVLTTVPAYRVIGTFPQNQHSTGRASDEEELVFGGADYDGLAAS